jgi:hypothetical protein
MRKASIPEFCSLKCSSHNLLWLINRTQALENPRASLSKSKCSPERLPSKAATPPTRTSSASLPLRLKSLQRKSSISKPQLQTKKCNTEADYVDLEQVGAIREGATETPSRSLRVDHASNRNRRDRVAVLVQLWE